MAEVMSSAEADIGVSILIMDTTKSIMLQY